MTNDEKLDLYFFDPLKDEKKYSQEYFKITGDRSVVFYSPLYLLRRHVLLLSGKLITFPKPPVYQLPYFSAIMLSNITITSLYQLSACCDYDEFYRLYLNKSEIQHLGLRCLRNSLEHNSYQLLTRVKRGRSSRTRRSYRKIKTFFDSDTRVDWSTIDHIKIVFELSSFSGYKIVKDPIIRKIHSNYLLVLFTIDPFRFLAKVDDAAVSVSKDILSSDTLQAKFNRNIKSKNWIPVYER